MIIYLAGGGHIGGKYQQFKEHMMIIYLAGGVSGNLNPAWKRVAKGESFKEALRHENFWQGGGESRHWILTSPTKENEVIFSESAHDPDVQGGGRELAENIFGGIFSDEDISMHGQRDFLQLGITRPDPARGGL